ncbi:MAG: alpha/beta fold hydrolase [Candidatus Nanohaloarchaea archaeon]|nr:alpha/beta fold hydrolase [Candidatus Nanohaloarchaea archaeon]
MTGPVAYWDENGTEGTVRVDEREIRVTEFGPENGGPTLIGVTGGPGMPKEHFAPLARFAEQGYHVVVYDQHNIGASDDADDPHQIETFTEELDALTDRYTSAIPVGHSWGSMLSLEYATTHDGFEAVIAVAPLFDTQKNITIAETIRAETLSTEELATMLELEADQRYDDERYRELEDRLDAARGHQPPIPSFAEDQYDRMNVAMYEAMWGPIEYHLSDDATLKNWSVLDRLGQIDVPILLITGEDDAFGIHDLFEAQQMIGNHCSVDIIDDASHNPHWEQHEQFMTLVSDWLADHS